MEPKQVTEYIKAIGDGLKPIADSLGQASGRLFDFAVRHNYAVAASELVLFAGFIIATIPVYRLIRWGLTKEKTSDGYSRTETRFYHNEGAGVVAVVSGIIIGLGLLVSGYYATSDAMPRLIAPEWSAISDVIAAVHPK